MNYTLNLYKNIAYGILSVLFIGIIFSCFTFQQRVVQDLSFRDKTGMNSNQEGFSNKEGLKNKDKQDKQLFELIENKLRGLKEEMGGSSGIKEVKEVLNKTKNIVNLECAKCMMNMLDENKGVKSIDFEKLLDDDNTKNCSDCKKYNELSNIITSMIENL